MNRHHAQTYLEPSALDAIRVASTRERLTVSDYLRRVVDKHLEGEALMDPVRVAFADATAQSLQLATDAFERATVELLTEVRNERQKTHQMLADFVELMKAALPAVFSQPFTV